mgnify:CR=1 FL=1
MLSDVLDSKSGSFVISMIIGLGLASFFKKICKDGQCVVIAGPNVNDVKKTSTKSMMNAIDTHR